MCRTHEILHRNVTWVQFSRLTTRKTKKIDHLLRDYQYNIMESGIYNDVNAAFKKLFSASKNSCSLNFVKNCLIFQEF